jgi:hypothetical protein
VNTDLPLGTFPGNFAQQSRDELRDQSWEDFFSQMNSEAFASLCYKLVDLHCLTRSCLVSKLGEAFEKSENMESVLLKRASHHTSLTQNQLALREQTLKVLKAGSSNIEDIARTQSTILDAMIGGKTPQTFCIVNTSRLKQLRPWPKAVVLQDIQNTSLDKTDEDAITQPELISIALQLIWTLAALNAAFPGFQHNSLARSVRLYTYGSRCYRLKHSETAYYIPAGYPLPVIVNWSTCDAPNSEGLPYRSGKSDPGKDVNDMLDAILGSISREMPPRLFKPILKMKSFCTTHYYKYNRDKGDGSVHIDDVILGNRECVPHILQTRCPEGYDLRNDQCIKCVTNLGAPSTFRDDGTCLNRVGDLRVGVPILAGEEDTLQNTLLTSEFFDVFLPPINSAHIASVENF